MPSKTDDPFIIRDLEMQHKFSNLNEQISKRVNSVRNLSKAKLSKTNATEVHPCLMNHNSQSKKENPKTPSLICHGFFSDLSIFHHH